MHVLGVIPAQVTPAPGIAPTPDALSTVLNVPLLLWAVNNLSRALPSDRIVIISAADPVHAIAQSLGLRVQPPDDGLETNTLLVHDPRRCFCSRHTIEAAITDGVQELAAMRVSPLERLEARTQPDLELIRAAARGLSPDHPCIQGVARFRLGALGFTGPIQAVISDVDGVLTDARLLMTDAGAESRAFHMHDGLGTRLLADAGVKIAWLSAGLDTGLVRARAKMIGVQHIDVGQGDKGERFTTLCKQMNVDPKHTIYVGDDINDLPAMRRAGLTACPIDAQPAVRAFVDIILETPGGQGAFRELANLILDAVKTKSIDETSA